MGRPVPTGNEVSEWRLWLLDNAESDANWMAEQIALAVTRASSIAKPELTENVATKYHPSSLDTWPRIASRTTTRISPWVTMMAREVEFSPNTGSQTYHSIETFDYVIVLAMTPDGRIPLVRQYRPAAEAFTLEFPGGIIDTAEGPTGTAARELLEETGFPSKSVHLLGVATNDAGRLGNRVFSYFIETDNQVCNFHPEEGLTTQLVTPAELAEMIVDGRFKAQANLGTLLLASVRGCFELPG